MTFHRASIIAIALSWLAAEAPAEDCDQNGVDDDIDIASGAPDCDSDGILDVCQARTFARFSNPRRISFPFAPELVAAGELDGDGVEDLAIYNPVGEEIIFAIRRADFRYFLVVGLSAAHPVDCLLVADLDGDGASDVLAAHRAAGCVSVCWGLGSGTFEDPVLIPAGESPCQIAATDLDGDADLDLVVLDADPGLLRVFRLESDRRLTPGAVEATGSSLELLVMGDFDRDGVADAAVAGPSSLELLVFLADGAGGVVPAARHELPDGVAAMATADLNRDGYDDIVRAPSGRSGGVVGLSVGNADFAWDVTLSFRDTALAVTIGDLDADADGDVVFLGTGGNLYTFTNRGRGAFNPAEDSLGLEGTAGLVSTNLNDDGRADVVTIARESGELGLYFRGAGFIRLGYRLPNRYELSLTLDVDGDGDRDLVVSDYFAYTVNVLRAAGSGALELLGSFPVTSGGHYPLTSLASADIDGDGDEDVVVGYDRQLFFATLENLGDGRLGPGVRVAAETGKPLVASSVAAADFDGDGDVDVMFAREEGWFVAVFANDGSGAFAHDRDVLVPLGNVIVRDLDVDGDPDILVIDDRETSLLRNHGDGTFDDPERYPGELLDDPSALRLADMNGDGAPDVVYASDWNDEVCVRLNDGRGRFAPERCVSTREPLDIAVTDLNDDGAPDVVATRDENQSGTPFSVLTAFLGRGDGRLEPAGETPLDGRTLSSLRAADLEHANPKGIATTALRESGMRLIALEAHQIGADCDLNGVPDACDISAGTLHDVDLNGVPDECERRFHRGDPNQSDRTDLSDAVFIFRYLYLGGDAPECLDSADANDDGRVDVSDGIVILGFLYLGREPPPAPGIAGFPCGVDTSPPGAPGHLGCDRYVPCGS